MIADDEHNHCLTLDLCILCLPSVNYNTLHTLTYSLPYLTLKLLHTLYPTYLSNELCLNLHLWLTFHDFFSLQNNNE